MVFSVVFEVTPHTSKWEDYLASAKVLRPSLEKIVGFIDNIRYSSLTRDGTILSLSSWRNEKALVRWRTTAAHHLIQEKGRDSILEDYRLRVGQVFRDDGTETTEKVEEQRFDETEIGSGKVIVLLDGKRDQDWLAQRKSQPEEIAASMGLEVRSDSIGGISSWDVFEAVLNPGDLILLSTWTDASKAEDFAKGFNLKEASRLRSIRVIREYGKYDRREAPQYYPDASGRTTIHS